MYIENFSALKRTIVDTIFANFHSSAHKNSLSLHRHQSFITSHLLGVAAALLLYPIYLYRSDAPFLLDLAVLLWFALPILIVVYVCRTGNLAIAHLLSSLNLAVFVVVGASITGGMQSFLLAWLVIVPMEAALSGNKRIILVASLAATSALGVLYVCGLYGWFVSPTFALSPDLMMMFGLFSALLFSGAIARTVQQSHEDGENAIRESELKYRLMADHATDMITVHNDAGLVTFVSPASISILSAQPQQLMGTGLLKKIHISDRPIYMTALSNCCNDNKVMNVEFRLKNCDEGADSAQYVWVEMRCQAVKDKTVEGSTQIISVTRDISSHKNQEIALLEARERAESANTAKTRFLANMSHELRTPLNAIIGFSDVLNMELYGKIENHKYTDYARLINDAGEHLLSVVNNILDMSKIEVGKFTITPELFLLPPLLNSCCEMVEPMALEKRVKIIQQFHSELKELNADSRAVKQMALNLLSNAIKFSDVDSTVILRTTSNSDHYYIDFIDEGIGISAQDLPKLCNPFVQADSSYKREHEGVGLGLSVVKGLAELHGGCLKIESELGTGTKVRIELPRSSLLQFESFKIEPPDDEVRDRVQTEAGSVVSLRQRA